MKQQTNLGYYLTPEEFCGRIDNYFKNGLSRESAFKDLNSIHACITNGHRFFCSKSARLKVNNEFIDILKLTIIKNEDELYQGIAGIGSKQYYRQIQKANEEDSLSETQKAHFERAMTEMQRMLPK